MKNKNTTMKNKNTTTKSKRVRVSTREFGEGSYGLKYRVVIGPWSLSMQQMFQRLIDDGIYSYYDRDISDLMKGAEYKLVDVHNKNGELIESLLYRFEPEGKWNCCGPFYLLMEEQLYVDIVTRLKS